MASNRDRLGRGLELLGEGLAPFVDHYLTAHTAVHTTAAVGGTGRDRGRIHQTRGPMRHGSPTSLGRAYGGVQLRVLTEDWRAFTDALSRVERAFAAELWDVRNRWARNAAFSAEDTSRALDTMARLLIAAGATDQAEEVRRLRADHQRVTFAAGNRRAVGVPPAGVTVPGQGLKSWREVLAPHEEVATGAFSASAFLADLHLAAQREGAGNYVDPVLFFGRTLLTGGLRALLNGALRRVRGEPDASPIVTVQTSFGGGKTHSMLALWHLLSGPPVAAFPPEVADLVADRPQPERVARVVLVGTHLPPGRGLVKPDGTRVSTMWGELAWQLGGAPAYEVLAAADTSRTNPGEALRDVVAAYAPCLILIDEWVAYARHLWGRDDQLAGTFDSQFAFARSLAEAVTTVPGALLVVSIPGAPDPEAGGESGGAALEVGGPNGEEALHRLQNVMGDLADRWQPTTREESVEIVRRRLFKAPDAQARSDIAAAARQFSHLYARHGDDFPREAVDPAYEQRIRAAYPIHPELLERLNTDWSTLARFQGTRGVLQVMSAVVHAAWTAQDASPMILPGAVPFDTPTVTRMITDYLPESWQPILDRDVDGVGSTAVTIDAERPTLGARAITRRLARSVVMGSAPTLHSAYPGVERERVWLGTAVPGDTVGTFGSAIDLLLQRATYLCAQANRYWFDTRASMTRTVADYADGLRDRPGEVWAEIVGRLHRAEHRAGGGVAGAYVAPVSAADVPDTEDMRLVILHPLYPHSLDAAESPGLRFATEAVESRGSGARTNRNMIAFLAPDAGLLEKLAAATRDYLAWSWIAGGVSDFDLTAQQVIEVESHRARSGEAVDAGIAQAYHWALVPGQANAARPLTMTVELVDGAGEQLTDRVSDQLTRDGLLAGGIAARTIRSDLDQRLAAVWGRGHVSVGELWASYCRYPYLTRLRDRSVLEHGVLSALSSISWEEDAFALADAYDEATGWYLGLVIPGAAGHVAQVTDTTLLVQPSVATAQEIAASRPPANTRFVGVCRIDPERHGSDLARLSQDILQQLSGINDVELEVTVEVHATSTGGFPDDTIRAVLENAGTLRFQQAAFDDE